MRVAIIRRLPKASFSMDVYADGLISGLKSVRPDWDINELTPQPYALKNKSSLFKGLHKYYERYWRYPATLKQEQADIYHIIDHSDGHIAYWLKSCNKVVVATCHDLINFIYPENIQDQASVPSISMGVWKFAVKGIRQADRVIAVSKNTANDVMRLLQVPSNQLSVIPDAVESFFRPLPKEQVSVFRQELGFTPESFCLLNVGSSHPRKNVLTVLKVLAQLKSQGRWVHLWKTGADFSAEQKTFIQQQNLEDLVTYLGKPDKATLVKIYNAADILVAPSLYEGFGMTIIEAMACGTPVITSNVTSLPEVVGNAGILVAPLDVSAIAKAVCYLQDDSNERELMVKRGLQRASSFTWEKTAEEIAMIYEKSLTSTATNSSK